MTKYYESAMRLFRLSSTIEDIIYKVNRTEYKAKRPVVNSSIRLAGGRHTFDLSINDKNI
ncbi:MAG: hypothetical protein IPN36_02450 [Bacteroidetes bacterium]|nr:hypothetical protein [Bacteroidota bacterium]MBL0096013.1 hypothetical protein [Bacteroidota bacterium]